jgi:hypothetical protein
LPLQPRHEYAADLPHGLRASHEIPATESPAPPRQACTAPRPTSASLEPMPRLRGFGHWFGPATPSRLACRTRAVWQYRPVPSFSGLLPPAPCASRARLPPASASRCDGPPLDPSFHSVTRRLVAHYVLAAQPEQVAGAAEKEKPGLAAHRPKRPARPRPPRKAPSRSTDPRPEPGQQPSKIDFHAPRRGRLEPPGLGSGRRSVPQRER